MAETTDLQRLIVSLEARLNTYDKAMKKVARDTDKTLGGVERRFKQAEGRLASFGKNFSRQFMSGISPAGLVAGLGIGTLTSAISKAINDAADIGELATRIGVTTTAYQALQKQLLATGLGAEKFSKGLQAIGEQAATQGSFLDKLFTANGKSLRDANGQLRPFIDNYKTFADLIRGAANEQEKLAIATGVMGDKIGREFVEALNEGAAGVDKAFKAMQASGNFHSEAQVREAEKIRDTYNIVIGEIETSWQKMVITTVKEVQLIADAVASVSRGLSSLGGTRVVPNAQGGFDIDHSGVSFPRGQHSNSAIKADRLPGPSAATVLPSSGGAGAPGDAIKRYVDQVILAEFGSGKVMKNPLSSATGPGQFIKSTWLSLFRQEFPDQARSMSESSILNLRQDEGYSRHMIEAYAKQNAEALRNAGVAINAAALHLAHFLGPGGATKVLQADASTPISQLLPPDVIAANRSILGGNATAGSVRAYGQGRASTYDAETIKQAQEAGKELARIHRQGNEILAQMDEDAHNDALARDAAFNEKKFQQQEEAAERRIELERKAAEETAKAFDEAAMTVADFGKSIAHDLMNGVSAADALRNALNRLASQAIDQLFNLLAVGPTGSGGGLSGLLAGLFGGARAMGGPVTGGRTYLVGERGPELFRPHTSGTVLPSLAMTQSASAITPGGYRNQVDVTVRAHPSPYLFLETDRRASRISGYGDVRTLNTARRQLPETQARIGKLGTTSR